MSNRNQKLLIIVLAGAFYFGLLFYCIQLAKLGVKKDLHPIQQKVSVDSAKYIEVGKRMDNQIKDRESHENTTIYNVTNIIQQGKAVKLYYSKSDSVKVFVSDSLLKSGGYR